MKQTDCWTWGSKQGKLLCLFVFVIINWVDRFDFPFSKLLCSSFRGLYFANAAELSSLGLDVPDCLPWDRWKNYIPLEFCVSMMDLGILLFLLTHNFCSLRKCVNLWPRRGSDLALGEQSASDTVNCICLQFEYYPGFSAQAETDRSLLCNSDPGSGELSESGTPKPRPYLSEGEGNGSK